MTLDVTLLVRAIEAILYVSVDPMPIERIEKIFEQEGVERAQVREALDKLRRDYVGRGVELCEVSGGYQMRTSPELADFLSRLSMPRAIKLSQAALEALAIVAYRQPVTRADVEEVRGVDCGGVLRSLQERGMVRVVGKKDVPGRPLLYGTAKKFLEVFSLSSLTDLPTLRQIEEFAEEDELDAVDAPDVMDESGNLAKPGTEAGPEQSQPEESIETPEAEPELPLLDENVD